MVYRRGVQPFWTLCTHAVQLCFKFKPPANSEFFPTKKTQICVYLGPNISFSVLSAKYLQKITSDISRTIFIPVLPAWAVKFLHRKLCFFLLNLSKGYF